jgi:pilus assembly protein Flp/PilA
VYVSFHPCNNLSHFIRGKLEARVVIIRKFLKDENGATAIEDGLIAAGISVPIIANVTSLGGKLVTTFGKVDTALN